MAAPAAPRVDVPGLDRHIVRALASVRLAREVCRRAGTPANVSARDRAEANLDALLDYRSDLARRGRVDDVRTPLPAVPQLRE